MTCLIHANFPTIKNYTERTFILWHVSMCNGRAINSNWELQGAYAKGHTSVSYKFKLK